MTTRRLRTSFGYAVAFAAIIVPASCTAQQRDASAGPVDSVSSKTAIERRSLQQTLLALAERSSRRLDAVLDELRAAQSPAVPLDEVLARCPGGEELMRLF
jgi:hypothetical protein